jgi:phytoene synthase
VVTAAPGGIPVALRPAYADCLRRARAHDENFPVASRLLPAAMRPHVAAVYAFARAADDLADEGDAPPAARLAALSRWRDRLRAAATGRTDAAADHDSPVFAALGHTLRTVQLDPQLLEDLLDAFAQDVTTTRYATWGDVLDYCRRSANPVGRLVLGIAGCRDEDVAASSDGLCTALQLTNFWQDHAIDWARGRLYVPLEEVSAAGTTLAEFDPAHLNARWREVFASACRRTRRFFEEGRAVCDAVGGRLRFELRLTWVGGTTILERVERARYDMAHARPRLRGTDLPGLAWRALRWESR